MINQGAEEKYQRLSLFCGEWSAGRHLTLEGTEWAVWVHLVSALVLTSTLISTHPALTNSPMHFCSFKLWGTILGMGAQLQQEDRFDFDEVTEKEIFPNWKKRLEKPVFFHLLYITIFLYYLSEEKKKKVCKWMKENSWDIDYKEWMFFKKTNLFEYSLRLNLWISHSLPVTLQLSGRGRKTTWTWTEVRDTLKWLQDWLIVIYQNGCCNSYRLPGLECLINRRGKWRQRRGGPKGCWEGQLSRTSALSPSLLPAWRAILWHKKNPWHR